MHISKLYLDELSTLLWKSYCPLISIFRLFLGTFKLKKLALQREGYNPEVITDQMYFLDSEKGAYRQLDNCLYDAIVNSRLRI